MIRSILQRILHQMPYYLEIRRRPYIRELEKSLEADATKWKKEGSPVPSPNTVKAHHILCAARQYHLTTLVETGTCRGKMIDNTKHYFKEVFSVELSDDLFAFCSKKFATEKHVKIFHGDSSVQLKSILKELTKPALFWLDAHYSYGETARGEVDCPIFQELELILSQGRLSDLILIDDERLFGIEKDYPSLEELTKFIHRYRPNATISVSGDIIWLPPDE